MGTISFKYAPGDTVFVKRDEFSQNYPLKDYPPNNYVAMTVQMFSREHDKNYYRLNDGRIFEECFLFDESEVLEALTTQTGEVIDRLESELESLQN